jgi:predicted nucleic acid-binding protein
MTRAHLPKKKLGKLLPKFKAVVDTNVWISGIFWAGHAGKILQFWRNGIEAGQYKLEFIFSQVILVEITQKLKKILSIATRA